MRRCFGIVGGVLGGFHWAALFQAGTGARAFYPAGFIMSVIRRRIVLFLVDALGASWIELEAKAAIRKRRGMRELWYAPSKRATILRRSFHHCAHIAVALTYLSEAPLDDGDRADAGTLQTLHPASRGEWFYHETVTRLLDEAPCSITWPQRITADMPLWVD